MCSGTPLKGNSESNWGLSTLIANGRLKNIYILIVAWPSKYIEFRTRSWCQVQSGVSRKITMDAIGSV